MMKPKFRWLSLLLVFQPVAAEVVMAPLFQDGAVLQREKLVPVWGHATAGKSVTVTFGGQTKETTADAAGRWQVSLDAMPATAENRTLSVTEAGLPAVEVQNVLVGEVWLASGQSNMQFSIGSTRPEDQAVANAGPVPSLRLFQVPLVLSHIRQETVNAKWTDATPETARGFSAIAYLFGKQLTEELGVPVGMIHSSWGGSRIEPWWAEEGLEGIASLADEQQRRLSASPGFPQYDKPYREFVTGVKAWADAAGAALDAGQKVPEMPTPPQLLKLGHNAEAGTYQAMIHPLVPYALRGFLWYQGESNNGEGMAYTTKTEALIAGWRKQFHAPEAPFLFVQLAPYNYGKERTTQLAELWWAQQETLKIPHTGMAVTNDIGNLRDIHPTNKGDIAKRLVLWALADTYGKADVVKSGPLFSKYKVLDNGSIAIAFDHTGSGLVTRDGQPPNNFEIAGMDGNFHPAEAEITADGKSIVLKSADVPKPDRARFAWSQLAEPNLMNKEGLPAPAFNTHWPVDLTLGNNVSQGKPIQSSHPNVYGWNTGLTDGTWGDSAPTCYATSESSEFPKTVTVDLGAPQTLHLILYGTPNVGSTKTVAVSISADGQQFHEVGRNDFPAKKATVARASFEPTPARYVRATFLGNHPKQDSYSETFGFLAELEAYAP